MIWIGGRKKSSFWTEATHTTMCKSLLSCMMDIMRRAKSMVKVPRLRCMCTNESFEICFLIQQEMNTFYITPYVYISSNPCISIHYIYIHMHVHISTEITKIE